MSVISLQMSGFGGIYSALNSSTMLSINRWDAVRAIVTVGAERDSDLIAHGSSSIFKHAAMSFIIMSVLDFDATSLTTNSLFDSLDPTEKGNLSYWLGMAFAKLACESRLHVPWLAHADPLIRSGRATLAGGNARADLIGRDLNGKWHVVEAKCRSSTVEPDLLERAKNQAINITQVAGQDPDTHCASLVRLFDRPISCQFVDPKKRGRRTRIEFGEDDFFSQYYHPFVEFFERNRSVERTIGGDLYQIAPLIRSGTEKMDVYLGVMTEILKKPIDAPRVIGRTAGRQSDSSAAMQSVGPDGVIVVGPKALRANNS